MERTLSIEGTWVNEPIATHDVRGGGGLRLHAREWGDPEGPPVVFIHGWSQSQLCWARQTEGPLADEFRIVTFDLRGHGSRRSRWTPGRTSTAGCGQRTSAR